MHERVYEGGTFDAVGEIFYFVGRTPLGLWFWKLYGSPVKSGHEADEFNALKRARLEAGHRNAQLAAAKVKPGAFATVRAGTQSSRYGKLPGGRTYTRDFKHDETRWHVCAHGQKQVNCAECCTWYCGCPGSPPHQCTRAA